MKFAHYRSLKRGAQIAVNKAHKNESGQYTGRKYRAVIADGKEWISAIIDGKYDDYMLVIRSSGPTIKEVRA